MTQSVYELRISLATSWRLASCRLCGVVTVLYLDSRDIQLQTAASLSVQNLFLQENSALKLRWCGEAKHNQIYLKANIN